MLVSRWECNGTAPGRVSHFFHICVGMTVNTGASVQVVVYLNRAALGLFICHIGVGTNFISRDRVQVGILLNKASMSRSFVILAHTRHSSPVSVLRLGCN